MNGSAVAYGGLNTIVIEESRAERSFRLRFIQVRYSVYQNEMFDNIE